METKFSIETSENIYHAT